MKNYLLYYLRVLLVVLGSCYGLASCSKSDEKPEEPRLTLAKETVDFQSTASSQNISIATNVEGLRATSNQPWCKVLLQGRTVRLTLEANEELSIREAQVTVTGGGLTRTLAVRQLGSEPAILIDKPIITVPASGGPVDFIVTSNVPVEVVSVPEWVKAPNGVRALPTVDYPKSYTVPSYTGDEPRWGTIEIVETAQTVTAGRTAKKVLVSVTQLGLSSGRTTALPLNSKDIKLRITGGSASSYQPGSNIENSYDGYYTTTYHSNWANSGDNYFPITLQYNFDNVEEIDYFIYYPRRIGNNGNFKVVELFYSENGSTWTRIAETDFQGTNDPKTFVFDQRIRARSVKFVVKSGAGDGQGFACVAEMEFYKYNPDKFLPHTLFKDDICTELKEGITEEQILSTPDPFFRDLAYRMYHNKYSREFRVAEFKPWTNPTKQVDIHSYKANPYSLLDNPTGISVEANEEVVIMVGDTQGHVGLGLWLVNWDTPEEDGMNTRMLLSLQRGFNQIKMPQKGLLYVAYYKDTKAQVDAARPIKIHFASANVNGYYDTQNPEHKGRWLELRNKAGKYFDLLGQYVHLTFPTENFKAVTPDGDRLAKLYDDVVYHEMMLHGLYKYNRVRTNRMLMHVMYKAYMYATHYHTAYNVTTANAVLNPEQAARGGNIWGPAHEIGHMNQTRKGVLWTGMTECTVNIPAAYIQTTILGQPCRVQTENVGGGQNGPERSRYTKAFNEIIVPAQPHAYERSDVFCQLIPFWQLELYFGKVLGRTPKDQADYGGFYPDVYEYFRTHEDKGIDNGANQLEFAYVASLKAGVDLTEFFEDWGFFKPVNKEINDYGTGQLTVTAAKADAVKQRIAALNLPRPEAKIQYISDHSVHVYKNKSAIQMGTASIADGKDITLSGFRNVVVWEVYNERNERVYLSDGGLQDNPASWVLHLPANLWSNGFKLYALNYKGEKTLVTVSQ